MAIKPSAMPWYTSVSRMLLSSFTSPVCFTISSRNPPSTATGIMLLRMNGILLRANPASRIAAAIRPSWMMTPHRDVLAAE